MNKLTIISALDLTIRTKVMLESNGFFTIRDIIKNTKQELLRIDGLGKKSVTEIIDCLSAKGFYLKGMGNDRVHGTDESMADVYRNARRYLALRESGVIFPDDETEAVFNGDKLDAATDEILEPKP